MTDQAMEKTFPFLSRRKQVISIVGAGGKTTLMYALAQYYSRQGASVVVTTTTHIERPQIYPVAENKEELRHMLRKARIVVAGANAPEQKLAQAEETGIHGDKLTQAEKMGIQDYMEAADIVLVEADGAKHFPCKVPSDTEPVIPKECGIVLGVMGMDAVGKPLHQVCFRREKAMQMLKKDAGHCMTEEDLAKILSSDWGTRKNVGDRDYYIVLNKCEDKLRRQHGQRIQNLLAQAGWNAACISLLR